MTRENKELLLKDLCSRLLYFTKVQIKNKIVVLNSICDDDGYHFNFICDNKEGVNIEQIKPYLFPLSSMTEEQKEEYTFIVDYISSDDSDTLAEGEFIYVDLITELMHFYNKYHLDYRGLIPKGLALDATGLNIY